MSIIFERNNKNFIDFRNIDSYNKTFNLIICPREAGKTAQIEYIKLYKTIKNNRGSVIILKRYANEINQATIMTSIKRINRYLNDNEKISAVNISGLTTGSATFQLKQGETIFPTEIMLIWLGRVQKLKNTCIENVKYILFDEYCVNPRTEQYQQSEMKSIIELYKTITRYSNKKIKFYFCGNPYSKFNPFTDYFKVPLTKMKPHAILSGNEWCVWCYQLNLERINMLKNDPIYGYDDEYANFALEGSYLIDDKYKILITNKHQKYAKLCYYIYYNENLYAVFNKDGYHYFDAVKQPFLNSKKKTYTITPLDNGINREYELIDFDTAYRLRHLKKALKMNQLSCNTIGAYFNLCEIYLKI